MTIRDRQRVEQLTTGLVGEYEYDTLISDHPVARTFSQESITDVVTPNYHRLIESGKIINNPMTYTKDTILNSVGGYYGAQQEDDDPNGPLKFERYGSGCLSAHMASAVSSHAAPFMEADEIPQHVYEEAKSKAMSFVDRTPYSFGEDFGEIKETLKFLKNPTQSLRDLSTSFAQVWKHRKKVELAKGTVNLTKAFADVWLQFRFAASPLLRSMHDAIESRFVEGPPLPPRLTARGKRNHVEMKNDMAVAGGVPSNYFVWRRDTSRETVVKAGILYEVTNPMEGWRQQYGLRNKDIPETLWALFPLSFMFDRLINISQALRGLESYLDPNVKYLAAWVTTKDRVSKARSFTDQVIDGYSVTVRPDSETISNFVYDRVIWEPSLGDVWGEFDPTGLTNDVTKVTDLIAIILSRFVK